MGCTRTSQEGGGGAWKGGLWFLAGEKMPGITKERNQTKQTRSIGVPTKLRSDESEKKILAEFKLWLGW